MHVRGPRAGEGVSPASATSSLAGGEPWASRGGALGGLCPRAPCTPGCTGSIAVMAALGFQSSVPGHARPDLLPGAGRPAGVWGGGQRPRPVPAQGPGAAPPRHLPVPGLGLQGKLGVSLLPGVPHQVPRPLWGRPGCWKWVHTVSAQCRWLYWVLGLSLMRRLSDRPGTGGGQEAPAGSGCGSQHSGRRGLWVPGCPLPDLLPSVVSQKLPALGHIGRNIWPTASFFLPILPAKQPQQSPERPFFGVWPRNSPDGTPREPVYNQPFPGPSVSAPRGLPS